MQIVIELSDLDYKWITLRKGDETLYPLTLTVYEAIKNGTPLPPHDRLIDKADVIETIDEWIDAEEYSYSNATYYLKKRIDNAPTILEANETELKRIKNE